MSARRAALARASHRVVHGCVFTAGCERKPVAAQFVGTWKSSRLSTPLRMQANGDWEIRTEDGTVLQYGVWQLHGQRLVWTIRQRDGKVEHDANAVVSVDKKGFVLRERDGSRTTFTRLD